MSFMRTAKEIPTVVSTAYNHYVHGPPQPSWNLKFHLTLKMLQSIVNYCSNNTLEQIEQVYDSGSATAPVPKGVTISESKIDDRYRLEAQVHLEKILKPYEHVLDTEWKDLKDDGMTSEWIEVPDDGREGRKVRKTILFIHGGGYVMGGKEFSRSITGRLAKETNARVFSFDYRLAPRNQFPAALQDALAAYLYLLNPPKDAGFDPLSPKHIIIAGESAGGGLAMSLGLAIRDAGLPSCAGIIGLSPWVDLTNSTPSFLDDRCDATDCIPLSMPRFAPSQALIDHRKKSVALTAKIKKQNLGPKIWHDSLDQLDGSVNLYAYNEALAIPYASPMLAGSLGNLPPLFLIVGDVERIRDGTIYLAHRSAEPTKYKGPSYIVDKFEESPFQTPTNTTLEVYEEMPHVFQYFDHICNEISYKHMAEFIDRVMDASEALPPSSYNSVNDKGMSPLNEHQKAVLKCETIGIVPDILLAQAKSHSTQIVNQSNK